VRRIPHLRAAATIKDNASWRRHKGACNQYRERWSVRDEPGDDGCRLLYQIICLMGTPPETTGEQALCMSSTRGCWRLGAKTAAGSRQDSAG
jgi:hypothetical protein